MGTGINLAQFADIAAQEDEGVVVHIDDPVTGEPAYYGTDRKPVTVTVAGSYSQRFRDAEARRLAKWAKQRRTPKGAEVSESQIETTAACILGWDGIFDKPVEDGGAPLPCTPENAQRLLKVANAIYQQLWEAMHDHERFFGTGSTS